MTSISEEIALREIALKELQVNADIKMAETRNVAELKLLAAQTDEVRANETLMLASAAESAARTAQMREVKTESGPIVDGSGNCAHNALFKRAAIGPYRETANLSVNDLSSTIRLSISACVLSISHHSFSAH